MNETEDTNRTSSNSSDPTRTDPFGGAPPASEVSAAPERSSAHDSRISPNQTTIIGVSRAGKTFLLAALQQACMLSGHNGYQLTFIPKLGATSDGNTTSKLVREAIERIVTGDQKRLKSDDYVSRYSFRLECQTSWLREHLWVRKARAVDMTIVDGPGGSLFPVQPTEGEREFQNLMIESIRSSQNLVICIDSPKPNLTAFRREFCELLERTCGGPQHRLGVKRLLLLLTKVDAVVDKFIGQADLTVSRLSQSERSTTTLRLLVARAEVTERRLAELIDPLEFARATLDQASLSLIRRSLHPRAQMAVGVCSSTGFYDDGSAFWDDSRSAIRSRHGHSPDDRLRDWKPFGVEEAAMFLLTGRTGSTIRNYSMALDRLTVNSKQPNRFRLVIRNNRTES